MLSKLWRLIRPTWDPPPLDRSEPQDQSEPQDLSEDVDWLHPPENPLDVAAWDRYWMGHVRHGFGPSIMDGFCDNSELIRVMHDNGMKRILCAGNGISQEPKAFAAAGLDVVALDLSPQAIEIARAYEFPPEAFAQYCDLELRRPGGSVNFVTGDILNPDTCPGPFDAIIERRTAQNYLHYDFDALMSALAGRLTEDGIFFSHSHDGRSRPPAEPRHHTRSWFEENGWRIWHGQPGRKPAGRVVWLMISTG